MSTAAAWCFEIEQACVDQLLHQLPTRCKDVLVAVNPTAGSGGRRGLVETLVSSLRGAGLHVDVHEDIRGVAEAAQAAFQEGRLRAIVAAGGDGTFRLVAEHTTAEMPLAILPMGTENLLSKYLDVPAEPEAIAGLIAEGCYIQLDAGLANDRLFTLMAGCGFDADVVRRVHNERQGNIHHLSYAKPILDSIRNYEYPLLRVDYQVGQERRSVSGRWVFVVNLPRYAGGLNFAPSASGTDGLLDVCTFKEGSLWSALIYLGELMLGQHETMEDFTHAQAAELRVESDSPVPYQLDGDPGGELPLALRSLPGRLRVIVDREWAQGHGFQQTG